MQSFKRQRNEQSLLMKEGELNDEEIKTRT